ncbi:MAG: alpha/beta fold hydrolase [Pseudomonadota bacterium]
MNPRNVLILPGWHNSGPDHWQSLWENAHGYTRVEQHSWDRPLRGDWISRLEDVLLSCDEPAVLVAHSLGCIHAAAWASHSKNTHRVKAALFAAPPDLEREDLREMLTSWTPVTMNRLPFASVMFASSNDPYCSLERATQMANAWGSQLHNPGELGHLNSESGLGDWPEAFAQLQQLMACSPAA